MCILNSNITYHIFGLDLSQLVVDLLNSLHAFSEFLSQLRLHLRTRLEHEAAEQRRYFSWTLVREHVTEH